MWIEGLVSENQKINRNNAEADSKHNRKEIGYIFQAFSPNIVGKTDRLESGPESGNTPCVNSHRTVRGLPATCISWEHWCWHS